jgi:cytochrome c oxidase assembly protein subunit 15
LADGGVFYEHTHRLWATFVGTLVVALTRWLGGAQSRRPLMLIGLAEILAGCGIFWLWPNLKGTGHFLTGIGGVVLLAGIVWIRNAASGATLVKLGWTAFGLVQFQGLLGGLRVVLFKDQLGIFHGALAQIFSVLLCIIALLTTKSWLRIKREPATENSPAGSLTALRKFFVATTILIFFQLVLGATMRHQHAGLAIPDFPLAYGKLWPATDPGSIARYNAARVETMNVNPLTAFQIELQMVHRIVAVLIFVAVIFCAWMARHSDRRIRRFASVWVGLICVQIALGAATVLLNKAADVATAHVLVGALSLATGAILCILAAVIPNARDAGALSSDEMPRRNESSFASNAASQSKS